MGKLDGKTAIITGGASGIGEATVRLFAQEGAKVVIADIMDDYGSKLADELGQNVEFIHTEVNEEKDIRAVVRHARKNLGQLDIMFNNAGADKISTEFENISVKDFDWTIGLHLRATFLGMKYAVRAMKKQGSGCIINVGSVAGLQAGYSSHLYAAAKAGIIQMTKTVSWEMGPFGIRVNCVCPGGIPTAIFGRAAGKAQEQALKIIPDIKKIFNTLQPIRRSGLPEDIAKAVLWLATDDSSFVTGQAILVDGGLLNGPDYEAYERAMKELGQLLGLEFSMWF
ncbi:MAG: glucose 1-dehydrogenase [Candidatus Helarchaeota archaeon]|nr:glucose 1-dehydrogenase [Candidatus Helarchaeota archaeon]